MKKMIRFVSTLVLALFALSACKRNSDDDPKVDEPLDPGAGTQEIVTRISMHLTDSASSQSFVVEYRDPKANGQFRVDSLKLTPTTTYLAKLLVFDDTKMPVDTVSQEIEEEGNYHRFHYTLVPATGSAATVAITLLDLDNQVPPQPIGLEFKIKTGKGTGIGNFNVNLRHFDNGQQKTDDIAGGEQDIFVNFPTVVK